MVELLRSGRSPEDVAQNFEPPAGQLALILIDSASSPAALSGSWGWVVVSGGGSRKGATVHGIHPSIQGARRSQSEASEYLTTAEAAALLRVKPRTLRNKVVAGVFREGKHFYRKAGLGPRWKRAALISWLEMKDVPDAEPFELAQAGGKNVAY